MAEVISSIEIPHNDEIDVRESYQRQEDELEAIKASIRAANSESELAGEEIRWQRADGYARYVVVSEEPLRLAHIGIGDAWQVEEALIRGLNLDDVRQMVGRERPMRELFADAHVEERKIPDIMDVETARKIAMECLLVRADQWREWSQIQHVDLEEVYESSREEAAAMWAMYQRAYLVLTAGQREE